MSMVPTRSLAPGASSQPAEIRARNGMGASRLHWGQRGVSGLGQCYDPTAQNFNDPSDPCVYDFLNNPPAPPPISVTDFPTTTPVSTTGLTPAQTAALITGATSGLTNTLAISQGGSVITNPNGTQSVIGSGTTAAQAAASAASAANPLASLSTMIVPIGVLALGFMLISSMGGKR